MMDEKTRAEIFPIGAMKRLEERGWKATKNIWQWESPAEGKQYEISFQWDGHGGWTIIATEMEPVS